MKIDQIAMHITTALVHPAHWGTTGERVYEILNDRLEELPIHVGGITSVTALGVLDSITRCDEAPLETGLGQVIHAWFNHAFNQVPGYVSGCRGHGYVVASRLFVYIQRLGPVDNAIRIKVSLMSAPK